MKKISRRNFLKTCAIAGSAAALTACGGSSSTTSGSAGNTSGSASSGPQTITFYPRDANVSSGLVGGFKGEYFASRGFNLDIWAYSDEKTNAILASGALHHDVHPRTESGHHGAGRYAAESGRLSGSDAPCQQL